MKNENLIAKPPVVVVLGHIDHGKTSLLSSIRKLQFTEEKPGGVITQHIGAYQIERNGKKITFLDTPGHEAFSQMRSRGAKVADIAILVIDACEGIKNQTKEVIKLVKETGMPTIVALNKVDKPEANPDNVKRQLVKEEILVESMGGKVPCIEVSAKTGKGVPELLDMILLLSEMEGLKADLGILGKGVIIESYLNNLRGPSATLLLNEGNLKIGDIVGTHSAFTKIKHIEDFKKASVEKALPSDPVVIFGFNQVPKVGEEFQVFLDSESAEKFLQIPEKKNNPMLVSEIPEGKQGLNLILKADVLGSLEAIEEILQNLPKDKVILRILKSEVGNINESDLRLSKSGKAMILGFRVKMDSIAKKMAEREKVRIMNFEVIYNLVEELTKFMEKIVKPREVRTDLGKVKVLENFLIDKNRQIIGGKVIEGEVKKGALIEVFRNEEKVGSGKIVNLQRNKKDIEVISKGSECGILFEGSVKIEESDILVIYAEERSKE